MYICKICKKPFSTKAALSKHITCMYRKGEHISPEDYYLKYNYEIGNNNSYCLNCGKKTKFLNIHSGYNKHCCSKCAASTEEVISKRKNTCLEKYGMTCVLRNDQIKKQIEETNLEKYGVKNPFQNKEIQNKQKNTLLTKYGVSHNSQTFQFKNSYKETCCNKYGVDNVSKVINFQKKRENTNLKRYGVKCVLSSPTIRKQIRETTLIKYGVDNVTQSSIVKEKSRNTCLKKYNVTHPMKSKTIKSRLKNSNINKYGVEYTLQLELVKNKSKETLLNKYGVEHPFQSPVIFNKYKQYMIDKYGVDNPSKIREFQIKREQTVLSRYGVKHFSKSDIFKIKIRRNIYNRLLNSNRLKSLVKPMFTISEYQGVVNYQKKYKFICLKCNTEFYDHLMDGHMPRCKQCYPCYSSTSTYEKEISDYINSFNVDIITNNRSILLGKELDIYVPNRNLGIEFNGLYWHSEIGGKKDRRYHIEKSHMCHSKGIQLLHIFEDEWIEKQDIVKSIIRNKLGLTKNKIYARKCEFEELDYNPKLFYEDNHLQGYINGKHFGLFYNNELVSCITFGKPRFNKNYEYEILRFCNKIDVNVVGGLSKLFKNSINRLKTDSVITYSDLRYGLGKSYLKCGFEYQGFSKPNYYYMKDYRVRENRLKYQKHLLETRLEPYDHTLSEWENMQLNGYDRIWDCGNNIYTYNMK